MIAVRGVLTSLVGSGYREVPIHKIEAVALDTALDTDADQFSVDIGMPRGEYATSLNRNSEVRLTLFISDGKRNLAYLNTGLGDEIAFNSTSGILSINGRDFSAIADSQAPPGLIRHLRPDVFVRKEAQAIGFSRVKCATATPLNTFYRDGSETYWDSWYRIYRKSRMWLWTDPDGTLIADKLNYSNKPSYYFGTPRRGTPAHLWKPIVDLDVSASKQKRVGEVWVYGEKDDAGFVAKASDPTMRDWLRRPRKIITSSVAETQKQAREEAWEEIAEGKVAALEIKVTVPLGFSNDLVTVNKMAAVNDPASGISGLFFVVGVQIVGDQSGFKQVVRMREKNYALSTRRPDDPENDPDFFKPFNKDLSTVGTGINSPVTTDDGIIVRVKGGVRWGKYFAAAAKEFHGSWDYKLFLGVMLSICSKETGFRNLRNNQFHVEWYPRPLIGDDPRTGRDGIEHWMNLWANDKGNSRLGGDQFKYGAAVGPMQLLSQSYKELADKYGGRSDEYDGGRWKPSANIRAGGYALAQKLGDLDPTKPEQIWQGVARYYGSNSDDANWRYAMDIKRRYENEFAEKIETVVDSAASIRAGTEETAYRVRDESGQPFNVEIPKKAPESVRALVNFAVRQLGKSYGWGAAGPETFDCSGLVLRAVQSAGGPDLTHSAQAQYAQLSQRIPKDSLLIGDIVWFGTVTNLHHVGIYIGNEHFLHAPHTGDVVKISALNERGDFYGAKRVFSWG